ncbi:MerR family transcriptional regulator [Enterococcus olivae]
MNISKAAKHAGVTAVTLRYYERKGLIPPVPRKNGGVRDYQQEDLNWIDFIVCMRSSGLSIETLANYTRLYQLGDDTLTERKELLIKEREKLAVTYKELGETLAKLDHKIQDYKDGKFNVRKGCFD